MKRKDVKTIKEKKNSNKKTRPVEVDQAGLKEVACSLYQEFRRKRKKETYAQVKEILTLLAKGGYLLGCFVAPGLTRIAPSVLNNQPEWGEWKRFNKTYLRRSLERLEKQGMVAMRKDEEQATVRITKFGVQKVLKYALDNFKIKKPKIWDGKWRLIIYDVPAEKRYFQGLFRQVIKRLGLYQLQKSVYLTPFPCETQIQFIKDYFGVKTEVLYMVVNKFEGDESYKKYFDL